MKKITGFIIMFLLTNGILAQIKKTNAVNAKPVAKTTKVDTVITLAKVKKVETKVISPEPHESTYKNELATANNYEARGLAFAKYVDALMTTQLTDNEKESLLVEKTKGMLEIDFMGYQHMMMKIKSQNLSFVNQKISSSLTTDQKAAFKAASQYIIDDFISVQNNTTKPLWPTNVPKPGYGWGKTVSSDKVTYTAIPVPSNVQPKISENDIQSLIGSYWTTFYGGEKVVFKITGYKKHGYKIDGFTYNIKTAQEFKNNGSYSSYYCSPLFRELDAEEIFYPKQYSLIEGYKSKSSFEQCNSCKGKGTVTETFSHTNDYQYTLGSKTTYYSSSQKTCKTCGGGGYKASVEDKAIACLDAK